MWFNNLFNTRLIMAGFWFIFTAQNIFYHSNGYNMIILHFSGGIYLIWLNLNEFSEYWRQEQNIFVWCTCLYSYELCRQEIHFCWSSQVSAVTKESTVKSVHCCWILLHVKILQHHMVLSTIFILTIAERDLLWQWLWWQSPQWFKMRMKGL